MGGAKKIEGSDGESSKYYWKSFKKIWKSPKVGHIFNLVLFLFDRVFIPEIQDMQYTLTKKEGTTGRQAQENRLNRKTI